MVISSSPDHDLLQDYYDRFRSAVLGAEQFFRESSPQLFAILPPKARANVLHPLIIRELRTVFHDEESIAIRQHRGLDLVYVHDAARIKVKKVNRALRTANIPTRQTRAFMLQLPIEGLPEPATNYVIGYQLNRLSGRIEAVFIIRPDGERIAWVHNLEDDANGSVSAPPAPLITPPSASGSLVRVKTPATKRKVGSAS